MLYIFINNFVTKYKYLQIPCYTWNSLFVIYSD